MNRASTLAGAVERLPIPIRVNHTNVNNVAETDGVIQSAVSPVANRVAKSSIHRQAASATGAGGDHVPESQVITNEDDSNCSAGTDIDGQEHDQNSTGRTRTIRD